MLVASNLCITSGGIVTSKREMIENHIIKRGVKNPQVLQAMESIERKSFVPDEYLEFAYDDGPLPIGKGQTISQPYIVAFMADALKLNKGDKVLEVGSGCGYNAAILSRIASKVYSIEIVEWLAQLAQKNLSKEGINNVFVKLGDGYKGWKEKGPFDAIIMTAACSEIPMPLKEQLKVGGRLLAPVGSLRQELVLLEKTGDRKYKQRTLLPVRFVTMTGIAEGKDKRIDDPDSEDSLSP